MNTRNWLFHKRTVANMTQEEVAKLADIQRPYYTQIESGVRRPSVKVAKRIGDILGFNWIIFFENECSETRQNTTA
ncbi:helix-turn-helix transcriptional regulator [Cytobacillus horneckiae]|uniref:helix-turn-helix transcriptional regulator n=1 Tax=Cytobacillus horneckiae TaxID=549687 RepID=UPI003D9A28D3